jgi:hypothetical protein
LQEESVTNVSTVDQVKNRARGVVVDQIHRRSTDVGTKLQAHVGNLRSMSQTMRGQGLDATANMVDYAADRINGVSTYLTQTDGDRMIHDLETIARENAMVTASIGFLAGLTAARLLKASASDRYRAYSSATNTSTTNADYYSSSTGYATPTA